MMKLVKIVIGEFVEAIIFIIVLIVFQALSEPFPLLKDFIPTILLIWLACGLLTPVLIWIELEKVFSNFFRR